VGALLERDDVNSNKVDKQDRIPLRWAASSGHEGVVRIMLDRNDVDLKKADKEGRTLQ